MDNRSTLGWFLAGLVAGSLTGILLAPDSGRNTRRRVRTRAGEMKQTGQERVSEAKNATQERLGEWKEKGREAAHHAREQVEGQVSEAAEGARTRASSAASKAERSVHAVKQGFSEGTAAYRSALNEGDKHK